MNVQRMIDYYKCRPWIGPKERPRIVVSYLAGCESVLDVGCGDGELLQALAETGQSPNYTGIDCNPTHLEKARERFPKAEWILGDFATHDFAGRTFGAVAAVTLFSGDGWEVEDLAPAIQKLWDLSTGPVLIMFNNFLENVPDLIFQYPWTMIKDSGGELCVRLNKSIPVAAVVSP